MKTQKILIAAGFAALVLAFQNCNPTMQAVQLNSADHPEFRLNEPPAILAFSPTGADMTSAPTLTVNQVYTLRLGGTSFDKATVTWSLPTGNSASCTLTVNGAARDLRCTAVGRAYVNIHAVFSDGSIQDLYFDRQVVSNSSQPPATETPIDVVVQFRIKAGTANGAYNTVATKVTTFVGQTLQIINDDTIPHQLHTGGNPCPHQPNPSQPGGMYNCVISAARQATNTNVYDHIAGTGALFALEAIDGRALYTSTCQGCHGPIATSTKRNRLFSQIKAAIASNQGGVMGTINLTDDQLKAISFSLGR